VPPGDAEALASRLTLLLKYDSLRSQLGYQATRWAQRYSWSNIADEIVDVYDQALGRKKQVVQVDALPQEDLSPCS
jgi:glycosyltransferase involved in cell wall biosynthesis